MIDTTFFIQTRSAVKNFYVVSVCYKYLKSRFCQWYVFEYKNSVTNTTFLHRREAPKKFFTSFPSVIRLFNTDAKHRRNFSVSYTYLDSRISVIYTSFESQEFPSFIRVLNFKNSVIYKSFNFWWIFLGKKTIILQ